MKGTIEKRTEILNVRLPRELILELDALVEKRIFTSRSEAIREFAREYILEAKSDLQYANAGKNAKVFERGG